MRKLLFLILCVCIAGHSYADSIDIDWMVDGQTYSQSTCTVGGDLNIPATPPTKYGHTFLGWASFTPIEYLESTGTQYINTGVQNCGDKTHIVLTYSFTQIASGGAALFGSGMASHVAQGCSVAANMGALNCIRGSNANKCNVLKPTPNPNTKHVLDSDATHHMVYNETGAILGECNTGQSSSCVDGIPVYLFAQMYSGDDKATSSNLRVYAFKAYFDGALVRDMIPVLDGNGVACMYDKVHDAFYYNDGTGDFVAGPAL